MFIDCKFVDTRWQWSFNMLHMHGLWRLIMYEIFSKRYKYSIENVHLVGKLKI